MSHLLVLRSGLAPAAAGDRELDALLDGTSRLEQLLRRHHVAERDQLLAPFR